METQLLARVEEDPDVCKKPAMRKNKKAVDFGLDPVTHVKHNGQDYFNMRYVSKGKVSIRNDSKLVVLHCFLTCLKLGSVHVHPTLNLIHLVLTR